MTAEQQQPFECWAAAELFGHARLAGRVSEMTIAGTGFIRIDVPRADGSFVTKLQNPKSIYSMTPCTEDVARAIAKTLYNVEPIVPVGAPQLPRHDDDDEPDSGRTW